MTDPTNSKRETTIIINVLQEPATPTQNPAASLLCLQLRFEFQLGMMLTEIESDFVNFESYGKRFCHS